MSEVLQTAQCTKNACNIKDVVTLNLKLIRLSRFLPSVLYS
jgi:hypothetical protein